MRLIDADVLMDHVGRDRLDSRELIMEMIENAPTVDPSKECQACGQKTCDVIVSLQEEIRKLREQKPVLCKDCELKNSRLVCPLNLQAGHVYDHGDGFYCAKGMRKDGNRNATD